MWRAPHHTFLAEEARALLTRLGRVKPLVLQETMVPAAALPPAAQAGIERHLAAKRRELDGRVRRFLAWLDGPAGEAASAAEAQRRFATLRMAFTTVLSELDMFADVLTQRSEFETGPWIAGLDVLAADALALPGGYYDPPPLVCYLDRGQGAAIRRARTRLPGGGESPVGIIRVPRERMVGIGIASSLVHEVGHQAAALLDLVPTLRPRLAAIGAEAGEHAPAWALWSRWLGEIVADLWAVARVGIAGPIGLIGVVSLPRAFVFRIGVDEPHPFPWIRVRLAIAFGRALWPHPQWDWFDRLWLDLYPSSGLDLPRTRMITLLLATMPGLVLALLDHRPPALRGTRLRDALDVQDRSPEQLRMQFQDWRRRPASASNTRPSIALAVLGQARADGSLPGGKEGRLIANLLTAWAVRTAVFPETAGKSSGQLVGAANSIEQ